MATSTQQRAQQRSTQSNQFNQTTSGEQQQQQQQELIKSRDGMKTNNNDDQGEDKLINKLVIVENIDKSGSSIRKPQKLGFYSLEINALTHNRKYMPDKSQLKYLSIDNLNNLHFDLNAGYRSDIQWGTDEVTLRDFLRWILENRNKFVVGKQVPSVHNLNTDFISYRGVLTRVMLTPYEMKQDWMLIAIKYSNAIYLHSIKTDAKRLEEENVTEHMNKMSFSGHRFEEYVCRGTEESNEPRLEDGKTSQFCLVMRTRIKEHSLVYAAEMDCVETKSELVAPLPNLKFLEVKTTASFDRKHQYDTFCRYKASKWWAQSYLGDVETIVVGFRDQDNFVRRATRMKNSGLPSLSDSWSPQVCINFLYKFLSFVKSCVSDEMICYRFYCSPNQEISCSLSDLPAENFMPSWYLNETQPSP
ncbi:decapping and exoribonuclease protein-like [Brevipalpus obovatus]|uniref:decapping and exoribonuclease protein-like n=1 Tax=Brevipalpus obovatus TaxID=246614 RepID=UPI003D9F0AB5